MHPIRFRHRATGHIETEAVYGEAWLRWAYGTAAGRLALRWVAVRPFFSRWYGWRMNRPASRHRVLPFIRQFGLDPTEFAEQPESFRTFNEFFYRRLKPGARPIDPAPTAAVFPADGRHLGFASLSETDRFYLKGQRFDLGSFLDDPELTRRFAGGAAVFSRLCPVDYHRFHFPAAGVPGEVSRLDGLLWSVSPVALRQNLARLWQNRRWLCRVETPEFGELLMVEIGATNVGSTEYTFSPGVPVAKGAEKGYFRFGGSAVLTLFQPGRVVLAPDLLETTQEGIELYARMGDRLGVATR